MARRAAPTLKDIAREVGVSPMAVSTVLQEKRTTVRVSEETRLRIKEAAQRLQYRPNSVARGLTKQRMNTIGIVSPMGGFTQNLYFMEVLNGILAGSVIARQHTTILPIDDWQEEEKILGFCDGRVDGLILIGALSSPEFVRSLSENIPVVAVHGNALYPGVPYLDVENEVGGYLATRYLLSQGHRRILHLATPAGVFGGDQRCLGYGRAMREAGIEITETMIHRALPPFRFGEEDGLRSMREYLERTDARNLPTAVFCASDAMAHGCIEALQEHGLRVPEHISVVGFDDLITAQLVSPPLTTIRQPFQEIGRRSVERLMERISAGPENEATVEDGPSQLLDIFPVELVIRRSVQPILQN